MNKQELLNELFINKIIVIARDVPKDKLEQSFYAINKGGIKFAEITFFGDDQKSLQNTANQISNLKKAFADKMYIGAGTITDLNRCKTAIDCGAEFIVSPNVNDKVIEYCNTKNVPIICGALTPTEIYNAFSFGADVVKVFPASVFGADYLKNICEPYKNYPLFAFGGININNAKDFLSAGAFGLGVGSAILSKKLINENNYDEIFCNAKKFVDIIKTIKE